MPNDCGKTKTFRTTLKNLERLEVRYDASTQSKKSDSLFENSTFWQFVKFHQTFPTSIKTPQHPSLYNPHLSKSNHDCQPPSTSPLTPAPCFGCSSGPSPLRSLDSPPSTAIFSSRRSHHGRPALPCGPCLPNLKKTCEPKLALLSSSFATPALSFFPSSTRASRERVDVFAVTGMFFF